MVQVDIQCSTTVTDYNSNMGGVDLADQLRSYYNVPRRSRKWWYRMSAEIFVKLLEHIQKHMNSSHTNPILLILDKHETHVSLKTKTVKRQY